MITTNLQPHSQASVYKCESLSVRLCAAQSWQCLKMSKELREYDYHTQDSGS